MQINLNVPTLPTVNELANRAATRAPRLSRPSKSNSFVSLLERVFSVNQIEEDPLPSPEEVAQVELEREEMFRELSLRQERNTFDGITAGAIIGTGLTVATALGGAPITAAVLMASIGEFTVYAGAPGRTPPPKRSLSDLQLEETTVIA